MIPFEIVEASGKLETTIATLVDGSSTSSMRRDSLKASKGGKLLGTVGGTFSNFGFKVTISSSSPKLM